MATAEEDGPGADSAQVASSSRFHVFDIPIDQEQLSVRSLGDLLDLQRATEEQQGLKGRSLGEVLSDLEPVARSRTGSGASGGLRPRSTSAGESRLATSALSKADAASRVVLLAVDGSAHSRTAFHWYLDELWRHGDLLLITHIYQQPHLPIFSLKSGLSVPHEIWQKKLKEGLNAAEKLVSSYESSCLSHKVNYQSVLRSGQPGETICEVAKEYHANIIVMGCRGGGVIRRTVLGSVASYTINHSRIPVTVVPHQN